MTSRGGNRLKVLISAYACTPGRGSEPGAGWLWAIAAARSHDVWVITRTSNRAAIEAAEDPRAASVTFVYVDLPKAHAWKRPGRGTRVYYTFWQVAAMLAARRLHARERFDLVHHVTFATVWLPALVCAVDAPFVLGPVGGGQRVVRAHLRALGAVGAATELALRAARRMSALNPLVRLAWRRASLILLNNLDTRTALPARFRSKAILRPNQCVPGLHPAPPTAPGAVPTAIYAGRLHRFKGVELAVRALALAPEWRLVLAGDGADLHRLRRIAASCGVERRVEFRGAVSQPELWRAMAVSDAFVLPSLKEGASFAAVEAAALGLPVVAFDAVARQLKAFQQDVRVECVRPEESATGIAAALTRLGKRRASGRTVDVGVESLATDLERLYARVCMPRRDIGERQSFTPEPARR